MESTYNIVNCAYLSVFFSVFFVVFSRETAVNRAKAKYKTVDFKEEAKYVYLII